MANKMIIDASHPEETRVVVLRGNRVEEFDFESASKRPLRGNIYLAKVTRVEPSLQAAFVDYGGNRHGFLAFSEIHPDYYQIPVADRQALLEEEALSQREDDEEASGERRSRRHRRPRRPEVEARVETGDAVSERASADDLGLDDGGPAWPSKNLGEDSTGVEAGAAAASSPETSDETSVASTVAAGNDDAERFGGESQPEAQRLHEPNQETGAEAPFEASSGVSNLGDGVDAVKSSDEVEQEESLHEEDDHEVTTLEAGSEERVAPTRQQRVEDEGEPVEQIGGDALEEIPRRAPRLRRQYKIQEVIKRRQVLLVQVVKEERGNKGAALTTYLSLAGRYSVLMPNTARGGGISRKITNAQDRSRLKGIAEELDVPEGMGVILRTAGASRTKAEVKRDFEYLLRMWETVRETTLASSAPTLVYEEGSLIKRAIRDLYSKDVEEIVVAGEAGYREARQFMRLLMPSHVNSVQLYRDTQPAFARAGVESQLDSMFSNQVTLKSGGYVVINQTEALVAIDVNSGRSTREHNIEDTALRTNLEAADEIARQLRLRDLAGLIVVDFIDMEESRNNRAVERRIKDALKNDRARIQVGRISHFGLLEMSRQRIRTGVLEGSTVVCPHCQGAGVVRSTASIALHVLRVLEDALIKSSTHDVTVRTRTPVALYILNQKRTNLRDLERRFGVAIAVEADDTLTGANYHAIERGEPATGVKIEAEPVKSLAEDFAAIVEEPAPVEEDSEEILEAPSQGADEVSQAGERAGASLDEGDVGRRPGGGGAAGAAASGRMARIPRTTARNRRTMALRSWLKSAATSQGQRAKPMRSTGESRAASKSTIADRGVHAVSVTGSVTTARACEIRARQASSRLPRLRSSKSSRHPRRTTPRRRRPAATLSPLKTSRREPRPMKSRPRQLRLPPRRSPRSRRSPPARRQPLSLPLLRRPRPPLGRRRNPRRQWTKRRGRGAAAGGSGRAPALSGSNPIGDVFEFVRVGADSRSDAA
jgi:ribonuclease E